MPIYLYVKTHNKTGLKYLGKTIRKDPHKYPGSGTRWLNHLDKHGYDYTTEILRECQTEEELIEWGLYYSKLWNVVKDRNWANLKEEAGDGGRLSEESKKKIIETKKKNGKLNSNSPSSIKKQLETKRRNNTLVTISPESIKKQLATRLARRGTLKTCTPESIAKSRKTQQQRGNLDHWTKAAATPQARKKAVATRIKNGTNGNKCYKITSPTNEEFITNNLKLFCKEKHLTYKIMLSVASGFQKTHLGGWWCCLHTMI